MSWQKFQDKKVVVTYSEQQPEFLSSPAVTVCPGNPVTGLGWTANATRNQKKELADDSVGYLCGSKNNKSLIECVEDQTYDFDAIVHGIQSGPRFGGKLTKPEEKLWRTFQQASVLPTKMKITWHKINILQYH